MPHEKLDNTETTGSTPRNIEVLESVATDAFAKQREELLIQTIQDSRAGRLIERSKIQAQEADDAQAKGGSEGHEDADQKYQKKSALAEQTRDVAYRTYGAGEVDNYRKCQEALRTLKKDGTLEFWGQESERLFWEVVAASSVIDDGIDRQADTPPAKIEGAVREDYTKYLDKKTFIHPSVLRSGVDPKYRRVVINSDRQGEFEIPVANIVSAGAFNSWRGRNHGYGEKSYIKADGKQVIGTSLDVVINYAERDTPLLSLEDVNAFIQPDGTVLFVAITANHRTAAAISWGQETVKSTGRLSIQILDQNIN